MDVASRTAARKPGIPVPMMVAVVAVGAYFKAAVSYGAATTAMAQVTATTFTWVALVVASGVSLAMEKPWLSKGRISERDVFSLLSIAFLTGLSACGCIFALRTVEPLRAGLLEVSDIAAIGAVSYALGRGKPAVIRGVAMALVGVLLIVWYDPSVAAYEASRGVGVRDALPYLGTLGLGSPVPTPFDEAKLTPALSSLPPRASEPADSKYADVLEGRGKQAAANDGEASEDAAQLDGAEEGSGTGPAAADDAFVAAEEGATASDAGEDAGTDTSEGGEAVSAPADEAGGDDVVIEEGSPEGGSGEEGARGRRLLEVASGRERVKKQRQAPLKRVQQKKQGMPAAPADPVPVPGRPGRTGEGGDDATASPAGTGGAAGLSRTAKARNYAVSMGRKALDQTAKLRTIISKHERSSVLLAAFLLTLCAWLDALRRRMQKDLSTATGVTPRKLHATVLTTATLLWTPIAALRWVFSSSLATVQQEAVQAEAFAEGVSAQVIRAEVAAAMQGSTSLLLLLLYAGAYGFATMIVCEYLVDLPIFAAAGGAGASGGGGAGPFGVSGPNSSAKREGQRTEAAAVRLLSCWLSFAGGLVLAHVCGWKYQLTLPLWAGLALYVPGSAAAAGVEVASILRLFGALQKPHMKTYSSSTPTLWGMLAAVPGALFGGGDKSLATYEEQQQVQSSGRRSEKGGADGARNGALSYATLQNVMRHIWENKNSRKILMFLSINFVFMFVEIAVGWMTNSLGLISDAGHMFFDNASLFIGLYASYMAQWKRDEVFTYGYARYEVLAGFVNAVFLVFVAVSVVMEALERLSEPPEIRGEHLLPVSVMGLGVNIIGLFCFHEHSDGGGHGGHSHGSHGHSHGGGGTNENMYGVYLHVLADAMGSVGVIISSLLIQWYGWHLADPVASIVISALILGSVFPLISATVGPLLSRVPEEMEAGMMDALASARRLPDVVSIHGCHVWKHHADVIVGTLHVTVSRDGDPQKALRMVRGLFYAAGVHDLTVQVDVEGVSMGGGGIAATHQPASTPSALTSSVDSHARSYGSVGEGFSVSIVPSGGAGHGHSHGGQACDGHGHGEAQPVAFQPQPAFVSFKKGPQRPMFSLDGQAMEGAGRAEEASAGHGHSHGGQECHGHGH